MKIKLWTPKTVLETPAIIPADLEMWQQLAGFAPRPVEVVERKLIVGTIADLNKLTNGNQA